MGVAEYNAGYYGGEGLETMGYMLVLIPLTFPFLFSCLLCIVVVDFNVFNSESGMFK